MDFKALPPETQAAIRERQLAAKRRGKAEPPPPPPPAPHGDPEEGDRHPCRITSAEYFAACAGALQDPNLSPTEANVDLLLAVLSAGDERARKLGRFNYFLFAGTDREVWDPRFNARLAYEGFFTITTQLRGSRVPLPELQPFYSVLTWPNFERSKHVRKALGRIRRSSTKYTLANCLDVSRTWALLDGYHTRKYGSNWLTRGYMEMLKAASEDPAINFRLHCVELYREDPADPPGADKAAVEEEDGSRRSVRACVHACVRACVRGAAAEDSRSSATLAERRPLAGEIGFSVGRVYTSLSGWTEERTAEGLGTAQLALLGRSLQQKGFAFWSLGHCYSPEMDYKRQLGHRVYPRSDFLALLHRHRGRFDIPRDAVPEDACCRFADGEVVEAASLLGRAEDAGAQSGNA